MLSEEEEVQKLAEEFAARVSEKIRQRNAEKNSLANKQLERAEEKKIVKELFDDEGRLHKSNLLKVRWEIFDSGGSFFGYDSKISFFFRRPIEWFITKWYS